MMDKELYDQLDDMTAEELMPAGELLEEMAENTSLPEDTGSRIRASVLRKAGFEMKNTIRMNKGNDGSSNSGNAELNTVRRGHQIIAACAALAVAAGVIGAVVLGGRLNTTPPGSDVPETEVSSSEDSTADSDVSETGESVSSDPGSAAEDDPEAADTNNTVEEEVYEDIKNTEGYKGEYINDDSCVILNPENYPEVDRDMLYHAAELAIDQYNFIAKRDKQGFFDTIGFDRILSREDAVKYWARNYTEEYEEVEPDNIYSYTINYCYDILGDELGDVIEKYTFSRSPDGTPIPDDEIFAELGGLLKKAAENKSAENADSVFSNEQMSCFNKLCHKYKSIDDSEFFSQPEKFVLNPSEGTKYIIKYSCAASKRIGESVYINIDMIVLDGGYSYHFDECNILLNGSESNVIPFYVAVSEDRWEGLSVKEAGEKIYNEYFSDEAAIARELYDGAWEVIVPDAGYDSDFPAPEPPTWDELMAKGDFALAASENGLDLSADSPTAFGDRELKDWSEAEEGKVYLIHEPDDEALFFIRYVSPDGKAGEFHGEDNHW